MLEADPRTALGLDLETEAKAKGGCRRECLGPLRLSILCGDAKVGPKKMVPSDPIHSLALRRHARHRALQTGFPSGFLLTPRYCLSAVTDQRCQVRLLVLPARSRLLVTAFHSLGTTVRSPDHHSKVKVPGLLLRNPAEPFSGPFDLLLHRLSRFRPRDRRLQRSDPLPENCPALPVSPRISTPLRGFCFPSGSKRSIRFGPGQARLPNSPDFPSLPAAGSR